MIKNLKAKHDKIMSLKAMKKSAESNLKHALILQNASTQDLIETKEHLIACILQIQKRQKDLNENKKFYGLLHHFGKKAYVRINDMFVTNKLKKYSQALSFVNHSLDARLQQRDIDAVSNIKLQIGNIDIALKNAKAKKLSEFCQEK